MLDHLPLEPLVMISGFLTLQDRLHLIMTCRHLFNVISKTNLYSELDLIKPKGKVEDILKMFASSRYPGVQVKRLSLNTTKVPLKLLRQLPVTFPKVTRVTAQKGSCDWIGSQGGRFTKTALQWSDTLETYDIRCDWPEILPALKSTVFPQLTELVLGNSYKLKDKAEGFDFPYFKPHIRNAPSLKKLTLTNCAVDLDLLEHIHANCPQLSSLELCNTHIIIQNEASLPSITPANSLMHLNLDDVYTFDTNGLLPDYITTKYRCLKELVLTFRDEYEPEEFGMYHNVDPFDVFKESDEEDEDEGVPEGKDYNRMYRALNDDFETTTYVYRDSGNKFFSNINPGLKTLSILNDFFECTLHVLSKSDMQLLNLTYRDSLHGTDQLQCISNIKSLKTLHISVDIQNRIIPIIPLPNITSLALGKSGNPIKPIDLDWLSSSFPSLEELDLHGPCTWNTSDNDLALRFPHLLKLHASYSTFDQNSIDFFTIHAPNIKILDLNLKMTIPITIDISNWELKELRLIFTSKVAKKYCYYKIITSNAEEILKVNIMKKTARLVGNRDREFGDAPPPMSHITSNRDKSLMFFKYHLSLTQDQITFSK